MLLNATDVTLTSSWSRRCSWPTSTCASHEPYHTGFQRSRSGTCRKRECSWRRGRSCCAARGHVVRRSGGQRDNTPSYFGVSPPNPPTVAIVNKIISRLPPSEYDHKCIFELDIRIVRPYTEGQVDIFNGRHRTCRKAQILGPTG